MAWDSDPEIAAMRDYGKKFNRPIVVAFSIEDDGGKFRVVTYGETRQLCKVAADIGDQIGALVADGTIRPKDVE